MPQQENNQYHLSRKTRTGSLVLMMVFVILLVVWRVLPSTYKPHNSEEEQALNIAWQKFAESHPEQPFSPEGPSSYLSKSAGSTEEHVSTGQQREFQLVNFDPNTATDDELLSLGLSRSTVKTILKFQDKGWRFQRKEDLKKLYTLKEEDYKRIAPYVVIADGGRQHDVQYPKENTQNERWPDKGNASSFKIDINTADAETFLKLPGIGPAFSKRIINFRNALGGFVDVGQIKEVYGFPDSTYQQLKDRFILNTGALRKLNLNTAAYEALAKHPYIGSKIAKELLKLRDQVKSFQQIEEIRQIPLINDEKYRKIAPYLSTH